MSSPFFKGLNNPRYYFFLFFSLKRILILKTANQIIVINLHHENFPTLIDFP